jgi:uncharacterized membrane protein
MTHKNNPEKQGVCQVCKKSFDKTVLYPAELIRPGLSEYMKESFPDWDDKGYVCVNDLHKSRGEFVEYIMKKELGEVEELENEVVTSLREQELVSKNVNTEFDEKTNFGNRLADKIASFGGSWKFIIIFGIIITVWIGINTYLLLLKPFDPYPFILLNLILSCLAALQAPVIMMSQNRQEAKDRLRSEHDYKVNLKAELEIRHLNEKIDFLLMKQWQRLLEIQGMQTELMEEILENRSISKKPDEKNKR